MKKETKLLLTPDGFKTWKLAEDFIQNTSFGTFKVPKNSRTDLASIPRIFWILLPPFGRYSKAAVIHDYLYAAQSITRKIADQIFYELMIRYDTYKWKAKVIYCAVRAFGWHAWKFKNQ